MRAKPNRLAGLLFCILLIGILTSSFSFSVCSSEVSFTGEAAVYYQSLLEAGFPADYAIPLTELHLLHPSWNFIPLLVTEQNAALTWSYVLQKETASPDINLISGGNAYTAYRHASNAQPEPGFYQASTAAVAYFLDPRNFLNETDLFQFCDLSSGMTGTEGLVAVLRGTFMENAVLENGKTYAEYLGEIGQELGINPVYLAVRIRQELGAAGATPVISGTCGTLLWNYYVNQTQKTDDGRAVVPPAPGTWKQQDLKKYDGLYNYYNLGATGGGMFDIYLGAMKQALNGTAAKSGEWGSASWNTRWKALYGGAYSLAKNYVATGQYTLYLQKFDVNRKSGQTAFAHQYMANVSAALTESRILFRSYVESGALDTDCTFRIPVYSGMPTTVSKDPANGSCAMLARSVDRYTYRLTVSDPISATLYSQSLYHMIPMYNGDVLNLFIIAQHSYGVSGIEYRFDGDDWNRASENDVLNLSFEMNFSENSEHILVIRGVADYGFGSSSTEKKNNRYFLIAAITISILPPPMAAVTLFDDGKITQTTVLLGSEVVLPDPSEPYFLGWSSPTGELLPPGAHVIVRENVAYTAVRLSQFKVVPGAAIPLSGDPSLRFYALMDAESAITLEKLPAGSYRLEGRLHSDIGQTDSAEIQRSEKTDSAGNSWLSLAVETEPLSSLDTAYDATFSLRITYADGSFRIFYPTGASPIRSARQVAEYALQTSADLDTPGALDYLNNLLNH